MKLYVLMLTNCTPFISLKPLHKTVGMSFFCMLLSFCYSVPAIAEGSCTADGGPFGTPGLNLPADQIGEWGSLIPFPVQATHTVVMSSGKVLFWRNAEPPYLFDPSTETYSTTQTPPFSSNNVDFFCAGHATMADGRVLVVGGTEDDTDNFGITEVAMFSPVTETWELAASMNEGRWYPTVTTLLDGRMLVNEGTVLPGPNNFAEHPEIYDPVQDTWTSLTNATRSGSSNRLYPFIYALSNGNALMAGPGVVTSLDLGSQDPSWSFVTSTTNSPGGIPVAAMYRPDKIIKTGVLNPNTNAFEVAEILDMTQANPSWRVISPLNYERIRADMVLLPDGKVMISGGAKATQGDPSCAVHAAEIWDPDTETFSVVASHALSRIYHSTSSLLPDGRILTAGGEGDGGVGGLLTAEIYSPAYLFKGPRPTITTAPATVVYGDTFEIDTPDAATIDKVSLIRPAATTHNYDQNQRFLPLNFVIGSGKLTVTAPAANATPPGDYMLFLINSSGSVSVAEFIRMSADTDGDMDGINDIIDNCPVIANPLQENNDGDAEGDICDTDDDNDGLSDIDEATYGSDVFDSDSDNDNLLDGAEVNTHGTNPILADTDTDGFNDDIEINAGSDPNDSNSTPPPVDADGDINQDSNVDIKDLLLMTQFVLNLATPDANQMIHADVAPLSSGTPDPDGLINLGDQVVLMRKVLGLITF